MAELAKKTWENRGLRVAGIAVLATLITLFFFSPRFAYMRSLNLPLRMSEIVRTGPALQQLANPFVKFDDHLNRVSSYRLFFPIVGHYLHLPPVVYFALPHLGCLLAAAFIVHVLLRHGFRFWVTLASTLLVTTTSWFFVSMGWLAYFDSWYVLGLLVVVFGDSKWLCRSALLIAPWVDERFVLTLPLALLLRLVYRRAYFESPQRGKDWREVLMLGLWLSPWILARLAMFLSGSDPVTGAYVKDIPGYQGAIPASVYALGVWHGIRWGWWFVIAGLVLAIRRRLLPGGVLLAAFAGTFAINVFIAEDVSRSISTLIPAVLVGALLWAKFRPTSYCAVAVAMCGLNLAFPAMHVAVTAVWPVRYFYAELDRYRDPPRPLDPLYWNDQGVVAGTEDKLEKALTFFTFAVEIDEKYADAYANRGVIYFRLRQAGEALNDLTRAIELKANNADYHHKRGMIYLELKENRKALQDFEQALAHAPSDWPLRGELSRSADNLRAGLKSR